jgi:hypothetical protein
MSLGENKLISALYLGAANGTIGNAFIAAVSGAARLNDVLIHALGGSVIIRGRAISLKHTPKLKIANNVLALLIHEILFAKCTQEALGISALGTGGSKSLHKNGRVWYHRNQTVRASPVSVIGNATRCLLVLKVVIAVGTNIAILVSVLIAGRRTSDMKHGSVVDHRDLSIILLPYVQILDLRRASIIGVEISAGMTNIAIRISVSIAGRRLARP